MRSRIELSLALVQGTVRCLALYLLGSTGLHDAANCFDRSERS
jgi:hypothetical protein